MNLPVARKLSLLGLIAAFLACSAIFLITSGWASACEATDTSCTKPYFKGTGSDVGTGGWFNSGSSICDTSPSSNYQDANFTGGGAADSRTGGIMAFAKESGTNADGGASDEFAAYALGKIEGDDA